MRGFNATLQLRSKSRSPRQTDDRKSVNTSRSKSPVGEVDGDDPMDIIFGTKSAQNDLMKTQRKPMSAKEWTPPGFGNRKSPVVK